MKYKAIIFDMDGTIIDSNDIWTKANQILIERRGIEVTSEIKQELNARIHGLAMHKSCALIKEVAQLSDDLESLIKEKSILAVELHRQQLRYIEGFHDFHEQLSMRNMGKAVATNAGDDTIQVTNEVLKLDTYFGQHIYGISSVNFVGKPDPAIYLYAAQKLGFAPEECLAVEDSRYGVIAAKNAGMYCIGINTGKDENQLKDADTIVDFYHQIDLSKIKS